MTFKKFTLYFRKRTPESGLEDIFEHVESTSLKAAKEYGKRIAAERAASHGGKYWFMEAQREAGL